jgi:DNA polymerase III alpha subunit
MYSIDKYYDHYVIKQDGDVLFHVDSLPEAEMELEKLNGKEEKNIKQTHSSQRYNNYHKHTHYSNIKTLDCISKPEDYIKRAVELGHTTYFTTEHGFQGNIYEAHTLCEQYGLKCVFGVEAYYVDDMYDKSSRSNYHLMLVAMNDNGRKEINKIMSLANTDGFYYKPRIDLKCLLSLTPSDVVVTTACVASPMFKGEDWEENFLKPVFEHFGKNLYLEVQNHNEGVQIRHNTNLLKVKEKYGIGLIHANDSHYIRPEDAKYRDLFLNAKGMFYEDESNFILDYPDSDTIVERYKIQGVLSEEQIREALDNTLIFDNAEGIKLDKEFKIPKITEGNSDTVLRKIICDAWKEEKKSIPQERIKEYEQAIYYEMDIIKNCGMADYFILDHKIIKKAVNEYNAVLTRSGRGSAVSFYVNRLLGLTEIDRLKSPITLYPTRFMSAERILSSRSLPD